MSVLAYLLLAPLACDGGSDDPKDTEDTGSESGRDFSDFVSTTTPYEGDNTCIGGSFGEVDPSKQVDVTLNGEVRNFEDDEPVPDATVKFWFTDDISASPDVEVDADDNGAFTTTVPVCQPIGYGTFTPPEWEETVDTYEVHQIFGYPESEETSEWVNSVSRSTANIIPAVIGVEWDETTAIIAGTAYDCATGTEDEPEFFGHAQVFVHDGNGTPPDATTVYYFSDNDLPVANESQADVNPNNGLWVAVNVPVGTWTVEMWGYSGTEYVNLGSTILTIKSGSVNISNIFAGRTDGLGYPDSCLAE